MEKPLDLNFKRCSIKNLVEDFIGRVSKLYMREAKSYLIEVEIRGILATLRPPKEDLVRSVEAIRWATI